MSYQQTLQDQLAEFDETYQDRLQLDTDGTADGFIEVGDDIKNLLTSFAEKIAQSVREETIERCIKYMRSGEIAGSFSEGCDCKKCDIYEKKVRKSLTTLATLKR